MRHKTSIYILAILMAFLLASCDGDSFESAADPASLTDQTDTTDDTDDGGEDDTTVSGNGQVRFESAAPRQLGLKGSGVQESALVTFVVLDPAGDPVSGREVNFELTNTNGGVSLEFDSARSDSNGRVQANVLTGSIHTGLRVRATSIDPVSGFELVGLSDELIISSLLPDQRTFSIASDRLNWYGCSYDGVTYTISARAADRYNNPVPRGTVIAFTSERGSVFEQQEEEGEVSNSLEPFPGGCRTGADGACSVVLKTQGERPSNCRITVLAYTRGEESFTDSSGNGLFDDDEFFDDLDEAFIDADEDGLFAADGSEELIDLNENGAYDAGDGLFTGLVCNGSMCTAENATLHVSSQVTVVWSTGVPLIQEAPSSVNFSQPKQLVSVRYQISDTNNQPLPAGTQFVLSTTLGEVAGANTFSMPSTNAQGPIVLNYFLVGPDGEEADSGAVTLEINLPGDTDAGIAAETFSTTVGATYTPPAAP